MKVLYFAWLAERLNISEERIAVSDLPMASGQGLASYLQRRYPTQAEVFADLTGLRLAVNQSMADWSQPLSDGDEVAIFPPMTGG